jgi:hypothetical protein
VPRDEALRELDEALDGLRQCRDTIPDDLWKMAVEPLEDSPTNVTIPAPPPPPVVVEDD